MGMMEILENIRVELGFPLVVSSGFRCPAWNVRVAETGTSGPHTTGLAIDISISGEKAFKLITSAIRHGVCGIGVKQKGASNSRFVHLDWIQPGSIGTIPRPNIWTY